MVIHDKSLLLGLARHIRKQETLGCFDQEDPAEEERAVVLLEWFADHIHLFAVPHNPSTGSGG